MSFRRFHLGLGALTFIVFFLTGYHMLATFPQVYGDDQGMRFMLRASHVYILFAALLNLGLGAYVRGPEQPRVRNARYLGSGFILLGTLTAMADYFTVPIFGSYRIMAVGAVVCLMLGILLHLTSTLKD